MLDYTLPLGKAEVIKPGKDVTVVGWGSQIYALENAISMVRLVNEGGSTNSWALSRID
jgi:pyruvate/2-oxoglutarate/acetoin dehydrogenase E1 component